MEPCIYIGKLFFSIILGFYTCFFAMLMITNFLIQAHVADADINVLSHIGDFANHLIDNGSNMALFMGTAMNGTFVLLSLFLLKATRYGNI